jgi:auxin influx carrier (AUX1 LAX family)
MSGTSENNSSQHLDIPSGDYDTTSFTKFIQSKRAGNGTLFDAFLIEASQQVGQSVLTLPWIFGNLGYAGGTVILLVVAATSLYCQFLLISLLAQYRQRLQQEGDKKAKDEKYVASYHEVIGYLCGPFWGYFSLIIVIVALVGVSTAQITSTASNIYALNTSLGKRSLSLILGGVFSSLCLVPTFRHYRILSTIALVATAYTAWYMTIVSAIEGPQPNSTNNEGPTLQEYFTAFTALLFMFGSHAASIEKADVMDNRKKYDLAYGFATLYVFLITLPNGITTLHTFGADAVRHNKNAFYLFPDDIYRNIGIVLMCLHEFVAFGLFIGPLFHMWEKLLFREEHPSYWVMAVIRLPVVWFMVLISVAMPFFGIINSVLGAFATTFGTFIIPAACYNLYFKTKRIEDDGEELAKCIPWGVSLNSTRVLNWILIVSMLVFGVGFGGWSSMTTLIDSFDTFHFFAPCYQC